MAEQKQDGRSKKGGGKKQVNQPHSVRMSEAAKAAAVRKHRQSVERHLAQSQRRMEKASKAATPRGTARRMRRERLRRGPGLVFDG